MKVIKKHPDGNAGDNAVTDDAEYIRNLAEKQKSQPCGKNNLSVVKYGDFSGGSACVGCRNGKLPARC